MPTHSFHHQSGDFFNFFIKFQPINDTKQQVCLLGLWPHQINPVTCFHLAFDPRIVESKEHLLSLELQNLELQNLQENHSNHSQSTTVPKCNFKTLSCLRATDLTESSIIDTLSICALRSQKNDTKIHQILVYLWTLFDSVSCHFFVAFALGTFTCLKSISEEQNGPWFHLNSRNHSYI